MGANPYRRNAELTPGTTWLGALLFAAALTTPLAARFLADAGPGRVAIAATDPVVDAFAPIELAEPRNIDQPASFPPAGSIVASDGRSEPSPCLHTPDRTTSRGLTAANQASKPGRVTGPDRPELPQTDHTALKTINRSAGRAPRIGLPVALFPERRVAPDGPPIKRDRAALIERSLGLDEAQRRDLQLRIALLGYDPRKIDGTFDKQTRKAIRLAQAELSVPVTGYLDTALIDRITELTDRILVRRGQAARRHDADRGLRAKIRRSSVKDKVPDRIVLSECRPRPSGGRTRARPVACNWAMLGASLEARFGRGS